MFNSDVKEKAIKSLKKATKAYNSAIEDIRVESESLFRLREKASTKLIVSIEQYISQLANTPKEFNKEFREIQAYFSSFNHYITGLRKDSKRGDYEAGGAAGAGVVMGAGVAALGPAAAIAIATTFGTASTGTAIAALSGAAASNAALAWLGGGALVAGGGGIAGGEALLMLAGPVGWGIGAIVLVGSGFWYRLKNAEIAKEAAERRIEIEGFRRERQAMCLAIKQLASITQKEMSGIERLLAILSKNGVTDYKEFDSSKRDALLALINHTYSLGQLLKKLPEGATQS
jgi:hypothetical protein